MSQPRFVRPYVLSGGRTAAASDLPLEAHIVASVPPEQVGRGAPPETHKIVARAQRPVSLAELAARLELPVGVTRVLVGDLTAAGVVSVADPNEVNVDAHTNVDLLERLLDGIRAL